MNENKTTELRNEIKNAVMEGDDSLINEDQHKEACAIVYRSGMEADLGYWLGLFEAMVEMNRINHIALSAPNGKPIGTVIDETERLEKFIHTTFHEVWHKGENAVDVAIRIMSRISP